jgi:hypothetical protein
VETLAAFGVGDTTASLNSRVNPNGLETKAFFEYGTTTSYGSKTAEVNLGSGTTAIEFERFLSGLTPNTTYHFRVVASNSSGASQGADKTFTTTAHAPGVSTSAAEPEASGEAAVLKGQVDPNGQSTTYQFECGTTSGSYTITAPVPAASAGSGDGFQAVSYTLTGLSRGTKYFCRLTASNATGKTNGSETSFTTPNVPGATTALAVDMTWKCATLPGSVEPDGLATKYWFEYGTTTSYGSKVPLTAKEVSAGTSLQWVEEVACGLKASTLYHYRLVAENSLGTTNGSDRTLTTQRAVTLSAGEKTLAAAAPLKVFSSNFTFTSNTEVVRTCQETELSGEVSENPGAIEAITTTKLQNVGGKACPYAPGFFVAKYSIPTKGLTLSYTVNGAEEGLAKLGKFVLIATIYWEGEVTKVGECEYSAELNGTYKVGAALEPTMTGKANLVKATPSNTPCFSSDAMSGKFVVTSSGSTVKAS